MHAATIDKNTYHFEWYYIEVIPLKEDQCNMNTSTNGFANIAKTIQNIGAETPDTFGTNNRPRATIKNAASAVPSGGDS